MRSARAAVAVFVLVELVALVVFLQAGRHQWFFGDEWAFVAGRSLTSTDDLLRPHWGHWVTLPLVLYRALYSIFGMRTYLPYQLLAISSHLGVVALTRVVLRRAGVGPWVSTLAAGTLALFGSGRDNVVWAFQITFTGALLFGLLHLVMADHQGATGPRDWWGLLAGAAALMCSAVGLVMVFVVGLAVWWRRGWRMAAFHTIPLLCLFGGWTVVWGERSQEIQAGRPSIGAGASFFANLISGTLDAMGQHPVVGLLLGIGMVLGVGLVFRARGGEGLSGAAAPLAMLVGALVFAGITSATRARFYGTGRAYESRYLYVVAAMAVPWLGYCAHALTRRWSRAAPVVALLLVIGIPGNVLAADDRAPRQYGQRNFALALAHSPALSAVPDDEGPDWGFLVAFGVTAHSLRQGVEDGSIPPPDRPNRWHQARAAKVLLFRQQPVSSTHNMECREMGGVFSVGLDHGDIILRLGDRTVPARVAIGSYTQDIELATGPFSDLLVVGNRFELSTRQTGANPPITICR